jgi:hypothetical protein
MDLSEVKLTDLAVVVLTGAGVSAESGIPTFRGAGGLWHSYRATDLATPQAFRRDPPTGVGVLRVAPGDDGLKFHPVVHAVVAFCAPTSCGSAKRYPKMCWKRPGPSHHGRL